MNSDWSSQEYESWLCLTFTLLAEYIGKNLRTRMQEHEACFHYSIYIYKWKRYVTMRTVCKCKCTHRCIYLVFTMFFSFYFQIGYMLASYFFKEALDYTYNRNRTASAFIDREIITSILFTHAHMHIIICVYKSKF